MNKAILIFLLISAGALADSPHCVSESTGGKMVTQCDDGTVTVVGSFGSVTVCKTSRDTVTCKTIKE